MDACVSPSAVEAIAIPAARADAAAASSLAIGEPPGPSIQGDCLSDQAWEPEGEESSSTTLSSLSAISSLSSDAQDTLDTQTARSSSAEPIAPDEVARGTGGSPTSAPPVADPAFVLQGKAASKLTKAQAIAAIERAGLPVPLGKDATVLCLRKVLQQWLGEWKAKDTAVAAKDVEVVSNVSFALRAGKRRRRPREGGRGEMKLVLRSPSADALPTR